MNHLTETEQIELIFNQAHADHKLKSSTGEMMIMYPAPHFCLGAIHDMPDDLFSSMLADAVRKQKRQVRDESLLSVCSRYGDKYVSHLNQTRQWRDCIDDVETYFGWILSPAELSDFIFAIRNTVKF
ncbi:hypothetical protein [Vibrio agarivorans]|uniref:Uncharacterized protein n=1 Tax=Vibrio agarivorans TaxID=153622 RepID=A0ABT7Y7C5_9VIBR|nr:hypothetical protein [Vibrio agarivorans]MDN2483886.1 hypothetical protein [Vibrio agarivorans]